jgi:hypothetical protein
MIVQVCTATNAFALFLCVALFFCFGYIGSWFVCFVRQCSFGVISTQLAGSYERQCLLHSDKLEHELVSGNYQNLSRNLVSSSFCVFQVSLGSGEILVQVQPLFLYPS